MSDKEQSQGPSTLNKVMMVIGIVIVIVLSVVGALWVTGAWKKAQNAGSTAQEPAAIILITADGFEPSTVTIKKGQAVSWVNRDSEPHQVATDPYPQENGLVGFTAPAPSTTDDSYVFIFDKAGQFTYHDHLNPEKYQGTIIVKN
jgi:plastocyanin